MEFIAVSRPFLDQSEVHSVTKVLDSGWVSQGPKVREFEGAFANYVGATFACAASSCTTALHLALKSVGVGPGNIVITVSHSFIATANSVRMCCAEPVFVDIDSQDLNLSPSKLEEFLSTHCELKDDGLYYSGSNRLAKLLPESPLGFTKGPGWGKIVAVLAVHQLGMPCKIQEIAQIAKKHGLVVIEDAACAMGSQLSLDEGKTWDRIGKPHSEVACFSFHPRKVLTTGDGGMLTTARAPLDRHFKLLRQHGMSVSDLDRHSSKRVQIESYETTGYNYRMTDIQAAVGFEQLQKLDAMVQRRRELVKAYRSHLANVQWIELPTENPNARSNWQTFWIRLLPGAPISRDGLMQYFLEQQIATRPGVMNAHEETPYRSGLFSLPNSERARREILILPLFHQMQESDVERVVRGIHA